MYIDHIIGFLFCKQCFYILYIIIKLLTCKFNVNSPMQQYIFSCDLYNCGIFNRLNILKYVFLYTLPFIKILYFGKQKSPEENEAVSSELTLV